MCKEGREEGKVGGREEGGGRRERERKGEREEISPKALPLLSYSFIKQLHIWTDNLNSTQCHLNSPSYKPLKLGVYNRNTDRPLTIVPL